MIEYIIAALVVIFIIVFIVIVDISYNPPSSRKESKRTGDVDQKGK